MSADGRGGRGRPMTCDDCGTETTRRSPSQRYCPECSGNRATMRKSAWAERHGRTPTTRTPEQYAAEKSAMVAAGEVASIESRASLTDWTDEEAPSAHKLVRVALPFDYSASKNAIHRVGRGGHVYARRESNAYRDALILALRNAGGSGWFQAKLWLDVFVEKPDHRGDAVNVVDLVCDAVKVATGVDDRWYSLLRLDWAIVKRDPRLIVGLRQDAQCDMQVCSYCGLALPLDAEHFHRNRSTKSGYTRACRTCSSAKRAAA